MINNCNGCADNKCEECTRHKNYLINNIINPFNIEETKSQGTKLDNGKPPISLVESRWLEAVADVLGYGQGKYGRFNWKQGIESHRTFDAAMRHLLKWNDGIDIDDESGKNHLLHASVNLMMLYITLLDNPKLDTRFGKNEKD